MPTANTQARKQQLIGFLVVLGVFAVFWFGKKYVSTDAQQTVGERFEDAVKSTTQLAPSPTPIEFYEYTIPYLRSRTYESTMGELQPLTSTARFHTYLTNYTSDGLRINGLLTRPAGNPPEAGFPAIVFVHGYIPPSLYKTTERYADYVNYLAHNGFVVFKIDLRGHGDSQGDAGGAYYAPDYVIDTLSAIEALKTVPWVHKDKIGLWGHSMAGNVTLRSLAVAQNIPAVAIWAGAGFTYDDLLTYSIQDNSYRPPATTSPVTARRNALRNRYGQFKADDPFWKMIPATNYLENTSGAIGLFHAVDDSVVSVEYSRNLNSILNGTTIAHEFHEYPSGGHNISGASFTQAMQDTVNFYKKYLMP